MGLFSGLVVRWILPPIRPGRSDT